MQITGYKEINIPFPKNWRCFVGWANITVMGVLRRCFPKWVSLPIGQVSEDGEFTPEKVIWQMKRDAAIILGKLSGLFDFSAILFTVLMASAVSLPLVYLLF